jgi:hypothetical protein
MSPTSSLRSGRPCEAAAVTRLVHNESVDPPSAVSAPTAAAASPAEAAAIVAAIERFMRATAPAPRLAGGQAEAEGWSRVALLEGVARDPWAAPADAWLAGEA